MRCSTTRQARRGPAPGSSGPLPARGSSNGRDFGEVSRAISPFAAAPPSPVKRCASDRQRQFDGYAPAHGAHARFWRCRHVRAGLGLAFIPGVPGGFLARLFFVKNPAIAGPCTNRAWVVRERARIGFEGSWCRKTGTRVSPKNAAANRCSTPRAAYGTPTSRPGRFPARFDGGAQVGVGRSTTTSATGSSMVCSQRSGIRDTRWSPIPRANAWPLEPAPRPGSCNSPCARSPGGQQPRARPCGRAKRADLVVFCGSTATLQSERTACRLRPQQAQKWWISVIVATVMRPPRLVRCFDGLRWAECRRWRPRRACRPAARWRARSIQRFQIAALALVEQDKSNASVDFRSS